VTPTVEAMRTRPKPSSIQHARDLHTDVPFALIVCVVTVRIITKLNVRCSPGKKGRHVYALQIRVSRRKKANVTCCCA
jgi:hypothetical protein